jgi:probable rRNA maturation factor
MIVIKVKKQSNYPVNVRSLKRVLSEFFQKKGIVSDAEASVVIVSEPKMKELAKKFLKESPATTHNVLSFVSDESPGFIAPPGKIFLGEIVICYKKVVEEARKEGKLIDTKVEELALHGALHLLGVHHEE